MIRKMFEEGAALKKQHGPDKVFDFSLGNPDLEPPPAFHRVFLRLAKEDKKGSHGYMPNAGFSEVREALAKKTAAEQQVDLDGASIVMSVGAAGALNTIFKAILNPDDEVIVTAPYFMEYRAYVGNYRGILVEAPSGPGFSLDAAAIARKLSPKTAAVLINSPNNPTGRIYPPEDLAALAEVLRGHAKKTGRAPYLLSDEPYRDLSYGTPVPPVLSAYENAIVASSYSKSLSLPGERIGFIAVGPAAEEREALLGALIYATRILGFVNAPALMQRIVAELTLAKVDIAVYARRRAAFTAILDSSGIEYAKPEGAFYLFVKVPPRKAAPEAAAAVSAADDRAFSEHLKRFLILGVPGSGFACPGWIRFAYCVDEKVIHAAGDAFRAALAEW
jgi:aspartate aminotransferase